MTFVSLVHLTWTVVTIRDACTVLATFVLSVVHLLLDLLHQLSQASLSMKQVSCSDKFKKIFLLLRKSNKKYSRTTVEVKVNL